MSIPAQGQMTLLTDYEPDSAYSLAYQKLYANISFTWNREHTKQQTVLLATPTPYPGQAAVAANVAITAAQSGVPTILVDADLHTPTLEQRFGVGKNSGLSDLLTHKTQASIETTLCDTFVPNLRLLPVGNTPQQATSLLFSKQLPTVVAGLRTFLAETEREPALIVFNSAAVLASTDAILLSDLVQQTFLTLISGRTTRRQAKKAQEQLQHTHGTLMGVIMLNV